MVEIDCVFPRQSALICSLSVETSRNLFWRYDMIFILCTFYKLALFVGYAICHLWSIPCSRHSARLQGQTWAQMLDVVKVGILGTGRKDSVGDLGNTTACRCHSCPLSIPGAIIVNYLWMLIPFFPLVYNSIQSIKLSTYHIIALWPCDIAWKVTNTSCNGANTGKASSISGPFSIQTVQ